MALPNKAITELHKNTLSLCESDVNPEILVKKISISILCSGTFFEPAGVFQNVQAKVNSVNLTTTMPYLQVLYVVQPFIMHLHKIIS